MVFSVFTTLASGKDRWICSPRLSVFTGFSDGGMPCEKSSGLAMSMMTLPARFPVPAAASAAREPAPLVALTISSAPAAASAKAATSTPAFAACHWANGAVPIMSGSVRASVACGSRVPITTSCPSPASAPAIVRPTMPVPSTAIFMASSF